MLLVITIIKSTVRKTGNTLVIPIFLTLIENDKYNNLTLLPYFMKVEYRNLFTHFIFTTLHRLPLVAEVHRDRIEKYITGITKNNDCHLYAIYANPEHMHFIVSRCPEVSENQLANIISKSSERFINENNLCQGNFQWQDSCSAFSVSKADVDKVCHYVLNQQEHHKKVSFMEEYELFMKFYQMPIKPK